MPNYFFRASNYCSLSYTTTHLHSFIGEKPLCDYAMRKLVELAARQGRQKMHFAGVAHASAQAGSNDFAIYGYGDFWADLILFVTYARFKARVMRVEIVNHLSNGLTVRWNLSLAIGQILHEWGNPSNRHNRRLFRFVLRYCGALCYAVCMSCAVSSTARTILS